MLLSGSITVNPDSTINLNLEQDQIIKQMYQCTGTPIKYTKQWNQSYHSWNPGQASL
jgi:hypothetical protein